MKSKANGFTLIELLAVIVILAIIALIATPIILGVIENAREGSAKSSALGYLDAVEKSIALAMLTDESAGAVSHINVTNVPVKGQAPKAVSINYSAGKVTNGLITVGKYTFYIDSNGNATKTDATITP